MERPGGQDSQQRALEVGAVTGGAAIGVGVDLLFGGVGGVVVGAATGQALTHLLERASGLRRRQAEAMLEAAVEAARLSFDELLGRIGDDPARLQLFAAAATAAAETALQAKLRALGRVLAAGALADDDLMVAEQRNLIAVLADLEAPHVLALAQIAQEHPSVKEIPLGGRASEPIGWRARDIEGLLRSTPGLARPVLTVLEGRGLIMDVTLGPRARGSKYDRDILGARFTATNAGRHCLGLLGERGEEDHR
jgi:hypothetical protein